MQHFVSTGTALYIAYEPLFEETGLVRPEVMVEFGARSTGEPHTSHPVVCDAAAHLPDLAFPTASPAVMLAERTFWEKANRDPRLLPPGAAAAASGLSRHWHDIARLDEVGVARRALADRAIALSVARHKTMFFSENDATGTRIDYEAAVSGDLQLCARWRRACRTHRRLRTDAGRWHAAR